MAATYGALPIPPTGDESPKGDPTLGALGDCCKAVLNAELSALWLTICRKGEPVKEHFTHDPAKTDLEDCCLPAIFLSRQGSKPERKADGYRVDVSRIRLLWVFPYAVNQEERQSRAPFINAIGKALDDAFENGRHVAWSSETDTELTAASYPAIPNSFILSKPTQTSAVTYSGAGLDGQLGTTTLAPRREVVITATGPAGTLNTGADIVVTAVNWHGSTVTFTKRFTQTSGHVILIGEDIRSLVSVALPAMLTAGGTIQIGSSAIVGAGSVMTQVMGLMRPPMIVSWEPAAVDVGDAKVEERRSYDAVAVTIEVEELLTRGMTGFTTPWGTDIDVLSNGYLASRAALPDNGTVED